MIVATWGLLLTSGYFRIETRSEFRTVGFWIALAHRYLSILDLTEDAWQPMESEDWRFVIAYNGEVYNYVPIVGSNTSVAPPALATIHTVWKFKVGKFVKVEGQKIRFFEDPLTMVSEYPDEGFTDRHTADRIDIEMPNSVSGAKLD